MDPVVLHPLGFEIDLFHEKWQQRNIKLFGKLGVKDVLCVFLLNPRVIFSTDSALKMSNKEFIDKSKHNDIYGIYQSIVDMAISGNNVLAGASFCVENDCFFKKL